MKKSRKQLMIFATCVALTGMELRAQENSEVRGAGEQATPGQAVPIIDYTNVLGPVAQPAVAPAPRGNQGIVRKTHECHRWVEWQAYKDAKAWGRWRDAGGTLHRGEWRCQVSTKYRYPSTHLGIEGECTNLDSVQCGILGASACSEQLERKYRNSPPVKVRFFGTIVVRDSKQFSPSHCQVIPGRGSITTDSSVRRITSRIKKNRFRDRSMKIGKEIIDIDIPIRNAGGRGLNRFTIVGRNWESERYDRGIRIGRVIFTPN